MPRRKQAHTSIPQGKKAFVKLKNGDTFIDKFRKKEKSVCYFDNHTVKAGQIEMMTIYRVPPHKLRKIKSNKTFAKLNKLVEEGKLSKLEAEEVKNKLKGFNL